jgi:uncharacterized protein YajQ (UPF0234 family)
VQGDSLTATPGAATADWRVLFGAMTNYATATYGQAAQLAAAVAELADEAGMGMLVDLRAGGATIDTGKDQCVDERFGDLARQVQAAARGMGPTADPSRLRFVQIGIDAADIPAVRSFWRAVLGYELDERPDVTDIYDPRRLNPPLFFQRLSADDEARRQQRNRIHVDVFVPDDQAGARIDAAHAHGGQVVFDAEAPEWWTLADPRATRWTSPSRWSARRSGGPLRGRTPNPRATVPRSRRVARFNPWGAAGSTLGSGSQCPRRRLRETRSTWWAGLDSNQRRRTPADLQSAPFGHLGTDPFVPRAGRPTIVPSLASTDMASFDVVSEVDRHEVRNAVDQAQREIGTRFDFKNTNSSIEQNELMLTLRSVSEDRLAAIRQVLEEKLVRRGVSLKGLEYGGVDEAAHNNVRQVATIKVGISSEKAREINKLIKDKAPKGVSSQTQGETVRVSSKKRDDLQAVIAALKAADLGIPVQFENFRS